MVTLKKICPSSKPQTLRRTLLGKFFFYISADVNSVKDLEIRRSSPTRWGGLKFSASILTKDTKKRQETQRRQGEDGNKNGKNVARR